MGDTVLGLVINPKLATPVLAVYTGSGVEIRVLDEEDWPVIGSGYYGDSDDKASSASGFPRSHTPDGVRIKKLGYGTCLYTALCLGAHQNAEDRLKLFRYGPDGDGISSESESRSAEADDWWEQAKRLRLANQMHSEEREENIDATSDLADSLYGSEVEGGTVASVNNIDVDIEKSVYVDVYPYDNADGKHLIGADLTLEVDFDKTPVDSLWQIIRDADIEIAVEPDRLLALDVRTLTLEAMNLIGILAETAGASEDELHDLRFRWEEKLDPKTPVRQMRLPFKKNSAEARRANAAVERATALRAELGWDELSGLP